MPRHANCLRSSPAARFARLRQRSGWGLLALLWIAAFSVQAQVSEAKVAALVEALRLSAPEAKSARNSSPPIKPWPVRCWFA